MQNEECRMQKFAFRFKIKAKPIRGIRVVRGQFAPQFWNQVNALGYLCYLLLKVPARLWKLAHLPQFGRPLC
jgi:hypothetical protein